MWLLLSVPFFSGVCATWRFNPASVLLLFPILFFIPACQPLLFLFHTKFSKPSSEEKDGKRFLFWFALYDVLGLLFVFPLFALSSLHRD